MKKVAVVDYGMCNLDSVLRAIQECGGDPFLAHHPDDFEDANFIILPGVGSFSKGIYNIQQFGLEEPLRNYVLKQGVPFLGICLGMQLLATTGWEGGETDGLGWIEGTVQKLDVKSFNLRIPHVGWNEVYPVQGSSLFTEIPSGKDFYFVHSYHFLCRHSTNVAAETPYGSRFASAVVKDNIWGVQFHPEKSQRVGFQVLRNFLSL